MPDLIEAEYRDLYGPSPADGKWTLTLVTKDGETVVVARLTTERLREVVRTLRGSGPHGGCLCCEGSD